tara:strand:- start:448 stop:918 length:471 start_codon:yes stop_codon:yes gene_type:complete
MNCPICFDKIHISAIGSCSHHFCYLCLVDWCKRGGVSCPVCKTDITSIRKDMEFDQLNGNNYIELESIQPSLKITFPFNSQAGITLENNIKNFTIRQPGVKVSRISKDKWCYKSGLRQGDIILFINKIPCINHHQVINIIDNAVKSNTSITLILQK